LNDACLLIIFAKAPNAGYAKTRLAPALGDAAAARLASRMLEHTVASALAAALGQVELCCSPDATHIQFQRAASHPAVSLTHQGEGDLGRRMQHAFGRGLARHGRVILVGTDAPALDAAVLRQAAAALQGHDAVFAPAADGGYALVGLSRLAPGLFDDIDWSTSKVMAQTRSRASALGLTLRELATLHDVDEPQDLVHVPAGWLA
jgi:rSAM/selenodomain-associated transferase 1